MNARSPEVVASTECVRLPLQLAQACHETLVAPHGHAPVPPICVGTTVARVPRPDPKQPEDTRDYPSAWLSRLEEDLLQWLRSRGARGDAEDIASDAIVHLLNNRSDLVGHESGRRWTFSVARNVLVDARRSRNRKAVPDSPPTVKVACLQLPETPEESQERRSAQRRKVAEFWRALRKLLRKQERRVLRLLKLGLRDAQISVTLGITRRSVQRLRLSLNRKSSLARRILTESASHPTM